MSHKPNPVALTACLLATRRIRINLDEFGHMEGIVHQPDMACLASTLHRIAPAFQRHAVALCNGEWRDGQRDHWNRMPDHAGALGLQDLDTSITTCGKRLSKRLAKINLDLAPLSIQAVSGGDPRGCVLRLVSTDASRPLPSNSGTAGEWCIA